MNLLPITVEPVYQAPGIVGMLKQIELVGRVCYHSEHLITEDSYKRFVDMQIKDHHMSPLEHGTVYLAIPAIPETYELVAFFIQDTYSWCVSTKLTHYVTTNYRVIVENNLQEAMNKYWSNQTDNHMPRFTCRSTLNIAGYKDQTRHRSLSPLIESTRFCNYSKDKFGNSINFIDYPTVEDKDRAWWNWSLAKIEEIYFEALKRGYTPQDASQFLPQQTAATTYWTAFLPDWEHFLYLRYYEKTGKVRPEVKEESTQIFNILCKEFPDYEW